MIATYSRIHNFKEYVNKHIAYPMPNAEDIAYDIHMSRSTLFRMVEKELGMSPFQYIRQEKLKKAKALLEAGNCRSIKEIAHSVGYRRTDYFSSIFKEAFGIDLKNYF